jgi:hypothetical protein
MSSAAPGESEATRVESDEEIADRIWRDSHAQARATLQSELYGGAVLAAPLELVYRAVGAGRIGVRFGSNVVGRILALLRFALGVGLVVVALALGVVVVRFVLWALADPSWFLWLVLGAVVVGALLAWEQFSKSRV